jgi:hypothetical protein
MKPYQAVGWTLLNTSAITAIVSTRVYHGLRPQGTTLPAINYFQLAGPGRSDGIETPVFSINCRASNAGAARDLARLVVNLFGGAHGRGTYGTQNGFDIARASLRQDQGLIPEPDDNVFNSPVDVQLVYAVDTVSH